jgi:hypothetical protein
MASFFEELLEWDRPFAECEITIGGKTKKCLARRESAAQADELDSYYNDEYGRFVIKNTTSTGDRTSELERVKQVYRTRTREELLDNIMQTRIGDVKRAALKLLEIEMPEEQRVADRRAVENDPEKLAAYEKSLQELYAPLRDNAESTIRHEYDDRTNEELIDMVSEVNINMLCLTKASHNRGVKKLLYTLYTLDKLPLFNSLEEIESFKPDTINIMLQAVEFAFLPKDMGSAADLPFVSPADPEPDGQLPSQSTSVEESTDGGPPTTPQASD